MCVCSNQQKQARWLSISEGKFELTEWHDIAKEWFKEKPRTSDQVRYNVVVVKEGSKVSGVQRSSLAIIACSCGEKASVCTEEGHLPLTVSEYCMLEICVNTVDAGLPNNCT